MLHVGCVAWRRARCGDEHSLWLARGPPNRDAPCRGILRRSVRSVKAVDSGSRRWGAGWCRLMPGERLAFDDLYLRVEPRAEPAGSEGGGCSVVRLLAGQEREHGFSSMGIPPLHSDAPTQQEAVGGNRRKSWITGSPSSR